MVKYIPLFIAIQLASLPLFVLGLPVVGLLALTGSYAMEKDGLYHFPKEFWLYDNEEDGVCPSWYSNPPTKWRVFVWSFWRNSVNGLRNVPGVSGKGRPEWIVPYLGGYLMAGWHSDGWPIFHPWTKTTQ